MNFFPIGCTAFFPYTGLSIQCLPSQCIMIIYIGIEHAASTKEETVLHFIHKLLAERWFVYFIFF